MKIFAFIMAMVAFVYADELLDVTKNCNKGHSAEGEYVQPGISEASCVLSTSRIHPGFDLDFQKVGLPSRFFFDTFVNVKMNDKEIPIRFFVFEDEKEYNAIQALIQTAYATRSSVSVIFANPMLSENLYDYETFLTKRKKTKKCYTNNNIKGVISYVNCSIESIILN